MISFHFKQTNENILKGGNKYFRKGKNGKYHIATPKVEKEESDLIIFPSEASIPLSEVLATVDRATNFLDYFRHLQPTYRREKPRKAVFFAGITAYGCNLGIPAMVRSTSQSYARQLENTANWYFSLDNINRVNDAITKFTDQLPLANMYRKKQDELKTSSDGQKITTISEDTIFASYSAKYYRLHNEVIKSTFHTTDTHGYTEAVFGLLDLLGFGFSPNIAKMLKQHIYTFKQHPITTYREKGYLVLPTGYFKEQLMEENWSEILRLVTSLKLKHCKASQIFSRFNSYSKQHPLYTAIKQYGRLPKTIHILRSIDDVKIRQEGRKSSNTIEASNRFSAAVFFANGGEMIYLTRKEQQIADACKNLIKNAIICWNYLYLTRKVQRMQNPVQIAAFINAIKRKTVNAWRHILFTGTYDYSDENMEDSYDLLFSQNYDLDLN